MAEMSQSALWQDSRPAGTPALRDRGGAGFRAEPAVEFSETARRTWHAASKAAGKAETFRNCLFAVVSLLLAIFLVQSAASANEKPGYNYVELRADFSKTGNDARGARSDAAGRLIGIAASWNVWNSWYLKAGYSLERSTFSNEVAGTVLKFRMKRAVIEAGGGRYWAIGSATDLYAEGFVVHNRVDHEIPDVQPANGGPPTVGKRKFVMKDTGLGAAAGIRHMLTDTAEIEGRFDIRTVSETTETAIAIAGRRDLTDRLVLGLNFSYGDTTNRHVGSTAKIGAALRYRF